MNKSFVFVREGEVSNFRVNLVQQKTISKTIEIDSVRWAQQRNHQQFTAISISLNLNRKNLTDYSHHSHCLPFLHDSYWPLPREIVLPAAFSPNVWPVDKWAVVPGWRTAAYKNDTPPPCPRTTWPLFPSAPSLFLLPVCSNQSINQSIDHPLTLSCFHQYRDPSRSWPIRPAHPLQSRNHAISWCTLPLLSVDKTFHWFKQFMKIHVLMTNFAWINLPRLFLPAALSLPGHPGCRTDVGQRKEHANGEGTWQQQQQHHHQQKPQQQLLHLQRELLLSLSTRNVAEPRGTPKSALLLQLVGRLRSAGPQQQGLSASVCKPHWKE